MMEKPKIPDPGELLAQVFHFDETILNANRDGQLTQEQLYRLSMLRNRNFLRVALAGIAAGIVMCILSAPLFNSASYTPLVMIGFLLFVGANPFLLGLKQNRDLRERQIASTEGVIHLDVSGDRSRTYSLKIQQLTFKLTRDQFFAFKNLEPYAIYYLPHSRQILSVEWLRDQNLMPED